MPIFASALLAAWALLSGYASQENTTPLPELQSSGWRDASAVAPVADFDAYVAGVSPRG